MVPPDRAEEARALIARSGRGVRGGRRPEDEADGARGLRNLAPGSRLGRFQIVRVVGEGAMGVVYLADDPEIERPVAVKTLRAMSEASPAARVGSRGPVSEGSQARRPPAAPERRDRLRGRARGRHVSFIAMEYVDGESLNRAVSEDAGLDTAARARDRAPGRAGAPARARARRPPPRHQAGQHPRHDATGA